MKKITSVLLALCLCLCMTACHGSVEEKVFQMPENFDTSQNLEISFWAKNDSNANQVNIYKQTIADFEALYPNITVNLKLYNDYGLIYNDVITNIATDTTPNVCITYPDHIATYLSGSDTVVPLNDLMADKAYGLGGSALKYDSPTREQIVPQFLGECEFNGYYYAIPYMRSTEACYVNKTYVEALGYTLPKTLTWDFIWEVSEAAIEKDAQGKFKVNGQKTMIPCIYKSTDNMMITQLKQLEAGYSNEMGDILLFNDTTKGILNTISQHAGTKAFSTFKISSYPGNFLNAGQCIFAIDSTAGATWMGPHAPMMDIHKTAITDFELEVMTVPQYDTENPKMISQGPSICVFNKSDSQEVLASWLFAQYLLTNDVQIAYAQTEGYVPVTLKAQESDTYQDYLSRKGEDNGLYYDVKINATQLLLDNTQNTFVTPVFNGSASVRNAAGQLIEEVTKTMRRGGTVDEKYIDDLYTEMTALYRLDQIGKSDRRITLGKMPATSIALLVTLAVCWISMGVSVVLNNKKSINR